MANYQQPHPFERNKMRNSTGISVRCWFPGDRSTRLENELYFSVSVSWR